MLKKLLYLYNDGHNPFPNMRGYGGLGYHLPQFKKQMHGDGMHLINGEYEYDGDDSDLQVYDRGFIIGDYKPMGNNDYVIEDESGNFTVVKKYHLDMIPPPNYYPNEDEYDGPIVDRVLIKDIPKISEDVDTLLPTEEENQKEIININPIRDYIKNWRNAGDNKLLMTKELNSMYNFTNEQKKEIDKFKKNNKDYETWITTQTFETTEFEEEPESFEPELNDILDKKVISEIKSEPLLSKDNINEKNDELLSVFNEYHTSEDPFVEYMGIDEYESLNKTYDVGFVEKLLYDNSGNYPAGKDFEEKVLANIDLVKSILISTYGSDRLDLSTLKINYDAAGETGDLFTVFDAHAVTFKLDGNPKESFIEFKKYSNYASHTSDLSTLLDNERKEFDSFIYSISQTIQKFNEILGDINERIDIAKSEGNDYKTLKKEYKKTQEELRSYLKENDLSDKEKLLKSFYTNLNPVGVGVKYTKFPPLPHDLVRSETSVNKQEGYDYIIKYEKNPKRRKKSNVETHMKAKNENIDILICTGLKNAMVVCNISDLLSKFPDKTHLDFLQLKKTVYGTTQKGTKKPDYDHFNVPISYFKNVNLNIVK